MTGSSSGSSTHEKWVPARPLGDTVSVINVPWWISGVARAIADGDDRPGEDRIPSKSGIGFTTDGDLLFWRKLSQRDWDLSPSLVGIEEIWIAFELNLSD